MVFIFQEKTIMPLVRIDLREGKSVRYVRAVGDAVQRAMVEHLNVPIRDHFQIIQEHPPEHLIYDQHYLNIERTDDIVMIQVTLSKGRSVTQKQAFYAHLATLLQENPGMRPQDVIINLIEGTREDVSLGNGEASYLVLPEDQWK
jgi:4-oxalocrotonate tautomerase